MGNKKGITIYQPLGKAREYSLWACNLYNGCTNECEYCFNRKGLTSKLLGKSDITPKKGWSEDQLFEQFQKEVGKWYDEIVKDGGIHFNFVSDPCLKETYKLNLRCIKYAMEQNIPVQILTKMHEWVEYPEWQTLFTSGFLDERRSLIKFGFTLTGMDELEPKASKNDQRIETMKYLHDLGYKTWASIEPIVNLEKAWKVFIKSWNVCDEFRIGLLSGKKEYSKKGVELFVESVNSFSHNSKKTIIWKNSISDFVSQK